MPYKRKSFKRKTRKNGAPSKSTKRYVKKAIVTQQRKQEHWYDAPVSDTAVPTADATPYRRSLLPIVRGLSQSNRIGKELQLTSIEIRGNAYRAPASTTHDRIRLILFICKNNDYDSPADQPNILNVLNCTAQVGERQTDVQAFRKLDAGFAKNYRVLKDWYMDLGYGTVNKNTKIFTYRKTFKTPLKVVYQESTDTEPVRNALILSAISDSGTGPPFIGFNFRVKFLP